MSPQLIGLNLQLVGLNLQSECALTARQSAQSPVITDSCSINTLRVN